MSTTKVNINDPLPVPLEDKEMENLSPTMLSVLSGIFEDTYLTTIELKKLKVILGSIVGAYPEARMEEIDWKEDVKRNYSFLHNLNVLQKQTNTNYCFLKEVVKFLDSQYLPIFCEKMNKALEYDKPKTF